MYKELPWTQLEPGHPGSWNTFHCEKVLSPSPNILQTKAKNQITQGILNKNSGSEA